MKKLYGVTVLSPPTYDVGTLDLIMVTKEIHIGAGRDKWWSIFFSYQCCPQANWRPELFSSKEAVFSFCKVEFPSAGAFGFVICTQGKRSKVGCWTLTDPPAMICMLKQLLFLQEEKSTNASRGIMLSPWHSFNCSHVWRVWKADFSLNFSNLRKESRGAREIAWR